MTEKMLPAIANDPLRSVATELLETAYVTVPLPLPDDPDVIVMKLLELLVAVQLPLQPMGDAVTVTVPLPPSAPNA